MVAILPALEYATSLRLCYAPPEGTLSAADYVDTFVANFPHMQELELAVYCLFDWSYLRRDSALKLRSLTVRMSWYWR
ncbi:hypothetical protein AAVH_34975, partial [Aphelenchoides avenae]